MKKSTSKGGLPNPERFKECTPLQLPKDDARKVIPPFHPTNDRLDPGTAAFQANILDSDFKRLFHLADNGDMCAIGIILATAMWTTEMLGILTHKNPKALQPWSMKQDVWPVFLGRKAFIRGEQKKRPNKKEGKPALHDWMIERLRLGEKSPLRSGWHNTPATLAALYLCKWLVDNEENLGLPPFSPKVSAKWFETAWECVLLVTKGMPEKNKYLRGIGFMQGKTRSMRDHIKNRERTRELEIRSCIKAALKASFSTITRHWV